MDDTETREKRPHPRASANPFSALTFWWVLPTFWLGYKRDLEKEDLFDPLNEHRSEYLGDKFERYWNEELVNARQKGRKPSLKRVTIRCFGAQFALYGVIMAIVEIVLRLNQPIFVGLLVRYFTQRGQHYHDEEVSQPLFLGRLVKYFSNSSQVTIEEAYICAAAIILCSGANIFFIHPYMMAIFHMGMKMRVACCSLIYRKALRLSKTALGETTAGQVVNLLSNDVNRFDVAVIFLHYLWLGPLETIIVTYFMYNEVGIAAVIGVASLLLIIPLQGYLGKKTSTYRLKTAIRTDERVRLMNEIISGVQVIKMYTWEKPFAKMVSLARKNEIAMIRYTSYIRGILLSFIMFSTRISIFITVLAYVLMGNNITAEKVFILTSFYSILRQTMTVFFPQGISQVAEALVSIKRLQNFLLYDELRVQPLSGGGQANGADQTNGGDQINGGSQHIITAKEKDKMIVDNANDLTKDETNLGVELKDVTAKWTPDAHDNTLSNINLSMKPGRLVAIIGPVGAGKSSLLNVILRELPIISGSLEVKGQVSFASQEPWLFAGSVRQNILFGQSYDSVRYKEVVNICALKRDFQLLPYGDKTIVGDRGTSLSGGQRARINLARAMYKPADIYLLDDPLSAVDTHVGKHLFDDCITDYLRNKTCVLVTHQLQYLKNVDQIIIMENGKIQAEGTYNQLQASGTDFARLLEPEEDEEVTLSEDGVISRTGSIKQVSSIGSAYSIDEKGHDPVEVSEQRTSGSVTGDVYKMYFRAGGNCCVITSMFFMCIFSQVLASGCDYWITYWTNLEEERSEYKNLQDVPNSTTTQPPVDLGDSFYDDHGYLSTAACIYILSAITIATVVFSLSRSFMFFNVCMRASTNLHDKMFNSITRATMYFFNTNTAGRILNRFSKDMGSIDELLPAAMIDCLQIGLTLVGIIIVVAIVNFWLLVPTVIVAIIFYFLRIVYLATSRSVKRLEGITRSPVFAHLNASLQGLTTIRAFNAQGILEKEFDTHQNLHSTAWYIFIASSRAFGFWLDLVCLIYITIVTLSFLVMGSETYGGNVGLAITQSIGLTGMFQWGMRQSAELENQMTSVERVVEYTNVDQEPPLETAPDKKPPPDWPQAGEVRFVHVFMRYSEADAPVLNNLNFVIQAKDKIGIVGRTGAGKSSLISALFRLANLEGQIMIDGVDSSSIGLHTLRSKISIIPQEPVLFSGTMRKNLDPFDEYSDADLWNALQEVELRDAVSELTAGLDSKMSEGGTNFSVGQRQLVCLARAIVRNNKILVLDEATANVDPQTDGLIQSTIRRKFANCTVLTIAHRLHTVMDSDKVLVMDAGAMVEYDHPFLLLRNKDGFLSKMVEQTGKSMTEILHKIAAASYEKKTKPKDQ